MDYALHAAVLLPFAHGKPDHVLRRMAFYLREDSLQGFFGSLLQAQMLGVPASDWSLHLIHIFKLLATPLKNMGYRKKMSYIFSIFQHGMNAAMQDPTYKQGTFQNLLKDIVQISLRIASLINREREREIKSADIKHYHSLITKLILVIYAGCDGKPDLQFQAESEAMWKDEQELTFQRITAWVELFSRLQFVHEDHMAGEQRVIKKLKESLVDSLAVKDLVPKWILFFNLLIQIQNKMVAYEEGSHLMVACADIILRVIDSIKKQLIPKLGLKNIEGTNLFNSMINWDIIAELHTLVNNLPQLGKLILHPLTDIAEIILKEIPQPEMRRFWEGDFENRRVLEYYLGIESLLGYLRNIDHPDWEFNVFDLPISVEYLRKQGIVADGLQLSCEKKIKSLHRHLEETCALEKPWRKFQAYLLFAYAFKKQPEIAYKTLLRLGPPQALKILGALIYRYKLTDPTFLFFSSQVSADVLEGVRQMPAIQLREALEVREAVRLGSLSLSLLMGQDQQFPRFYCNHCETISELPLCNICRSMAFELKPPKQHTLKRHSWVEYSRFLLCCEQMETQGFVERVNESIREQFRLALNQRSTPN